MYGRNFKRRIKKVYFGAYEAKGRSLTEIIAGSGILNHKAEVQGGVMEKECAANTFELFQRDEGAHQKTARLPAERRGKLRGRQFRAAITAYNQKLHCKNFLIFYSYARNQS